MLLSLMATVPFCFLFWIVGYFLGIMVKLFCCMLVPFLKLWQSDSLLIGMSALDMNDHLLHFVQVWLCFNRTANNSHCKGPLVLPKIACLWFFSPKEPFQGNWISFSCLVVLGKKKNFSYCFLCFSMISVSLWTVRIGGGRASLLRSIELCLLDLCLHHPPLALHDWALPIWSLLCLIVLVLPILACLWRWWPFFVHFARLNFVRRSLVERIDIDEDVGIHRGRR